MATNDAINYNQLKQSVFSMKHYVDDKLPEKDISYNLEKTETYNIEFDDEITFSLTSGYMMTYKNFDFIYPSKTECDLIKIKVVAEDNTSLYEGDINSVVFTENKIKKVIKGVEIADDKGRIELSLYLGGKRLNTESDIRTLTADSTKACIFSMNYTDKNKSPFDSSYGRATKYNIIFEYYKIDDKYITNYYGISTNLVNGAAGSSIQQIGNSSFGDYGIALGKDNYGPGWMIGYGNKTHFHTDDRSFAMAIGVNNDVTSYNYSFGTDNNISKSIGSCFGIGVRLNIPDVSDLNSGAMILGQGGTLPDDSLFTISTSTQYSTSNQARKNIRYPFDAKDNGDTYIRGKNVLLETETEITDDKSIVNKKYVDDTINNNRIDMCTDEEVDNMLLEVLGGDYSGN